MMKLKTIAAIVLMATGVFSCGKKDNPTTPPVTPSSPLTVSGIYAGSIILADGQTGVPVTTLFKVQLSTPVMRSAVPAALSLSAIATGTAVPFTATFSNGDSVVLVSAASPLPYLTKLALNISTTLKSAQNVSLSAPVSRQFLTQLDTSRKFPLISDDALLDKIQQQTFTYFWDFGHPVSGLARERNSSGETVTSGGTGFGIMAILTGISRNYVTRQQGLTRIQTMTTFLKNTAQKFHGAFPHWLNGTTGAVIPFSQKDDGADLVETSYLMQGLLTARQFFNGADAVEMALRADINSLYNAVEWDWFRQNNQDVLFWHWSPVNLWAINMPVKGWNEALITYVLGASSTTHAVPKTVYDLGWASGGSMKNGTSYYGYPLPLGPAAGGPLFFEHYSFLGINPNGLADAYANYATQTKNHTLINYSYCIANPKNYYGYSDSCWGLTASDIPNGYTASSPTNDVGVIAPTAAISSLPYTPVQSMKALRFFYYVLGDKLFKGYGFADAFSLQEAWFADSFLAIDQGPEIVMIENYRTGLLWNLFTSCPEVKTGMKTLGFTAPWL